MLTIALATVPTFLAVLVGIVIINGRFGDLNGRFGDLNGRVTDLRVVMDTRLAGMSRVIQAESRAYEASFKLLLGKIEEIDTRLTRLEERFAR